MLACMMQNLPGRSNARKWPRHFRTWCPHDKYLVHDFEQQQGGAGMLSSAAKYNLLCLGSLTVRPKNASMSWANHTREFPAKPMLWCLWERFFYWVSLRSSCVFLSSNRWQALAAYHRREWHHHTLCNRLWQYFVLRTSDAINSLQEVKIHKQS